jgi:hypothetical protein
MRAYVRKEEYVSDEKKEFGRRYDVWFGSKESAMHWESMEEAQAAVNFFERKKIEIDLPSGGRHVCTGFQVEERKPGELVIFCDGPFTLQKSQH